MSIHVLNVPRCISYPIPGDPVGVVGGGGEGVAALVLHHRPRLQRAPRPQQLGQHPHLLLERCHLQGLLLECL